MLAGTRTFQPLAVLADPGYCTQRIARSGGRERPELLESFAWHAKPLPLAFQPETHRAGGGGVATRACVPHQRARVDTRHQVERVKKLLRAAGQIVTVE